MIKHSFLYLAFLCCFEIALANQNSHTSLTKITPDGGIAITSVMCIEEDSHGFIWFGTNNGLFKYDTRTIKKYSYSQYEKNTLPSNRINQIYNDKGRLVIVTEHGLSMYRSDDDDFVDLNIIDLKGSVIEGDFSCLTQTGDGTYWILDRKGILSFNSSFVTNGYVDVDNNNSRPRILHLDEQGNLWVVFQNGGIYFKTPNSPDFNPFATGLARFPRAFYADQDYIWIAYSQFGLHCYDINGKLVARFDESNGFLSNEVRSLVKTDSGQVWVATYNGIAIFDGLQWVKTIDTQQNPQLPHHSVWSLHRDSKNTVWIGTWLGGLAYYNKYKNSITKQNHRLREYNIDDDIVTSFVQDPDNKHIWISSASGLLKKYSLEDASEESFQLSFNNVKVETIKTLAFDKYGTLWVGTYGQGLLYRKKGEKRFRQFQTSFALGLQVISILPIDEGVWVSDYNQGAFFISYSDKSVKRYRYNPLNTSTISSDLVRKIIQDKQGNLWFATEGGLNLKRKGEEDFERINYSKQMANHLSYDFVYTVFEDSKGVVWIGTNGSGLVRIDNANNSYQSITKKDGMPADDVYSIVEDNENRLWLATGNGICQYNASLNKVISYQNIEDISRNTFNANSALIASNNRLFFGSTNGFISFNPHDVSIINPRKPVTTVTNFYINNVEVLPSHNHPILKKDIASTKQLNLKYSHSLFSFKFVADNFINPEENRFQYRLHNFNEEWVETDHNGLAIFTNIPPGQYVFQVRASNNNGVWNDKATEINIDINPPLWKTWYAYVFYLLLIILLLFWMFIEMNNQRKLKEEIRLEKVKSESEENLHQMKLQFFTNISHEFRTPLTLIMGPIERLIAKSDETDPAYRQLRIVKNNSERLLRLINQILDFRKMNAGVLKLKPINNDLVAFSKNIFSCFSEHAKYRHFNYTFISSQERLMVDFDPEKLDKVIFNILSNAFKYCHDKGAVEIKINGNVDGFTLTEKGNSFTLGHSNATNFVEIIISDTGQGIAADNLPHIFERFQQADESKLQSSGIGLDLTKDYIQLHNGMLRVNSTLNEGSVFSILLPSKQEKILLGDLRPVKEKEDALVSEGKPVFQKFLDENKDQEKKALILLVEDNVELLNYLKDSLKEYFRIACAKNGLEGIQKVNSLHPDIVISDVMMPEMDGIEFCKTIKNDIQTSHIPFILLTALESVQDQIVGLESGADAYIPKPFSLNLLMAQVVNLINTRKSLKEAFNSKFDSWEGQSDVPDMDKRLILRAVSYVEMNIANSDISVEQLAEALNLSRTTLHRKLKSLTGQSATEFIRGIRLKNAVKMMLNGDLMINEVAFKVGFNSLNYFTRSFKNYYGMSPREYIKQNKQ